MTPDRKYGRTIFAPVHVLPEWTIDMFEGQALPPGLGKTEVPVNPLPELVFDMEPTEAVLAFQLNVRLRPNAVPLEIGRDLFLLYAAVNQLELNYGGAGFTPDDATTDVAPADGIIRVTLKPTDPYGAADRLAKVVSTINAAVNNAAAGETSILQFPTIERCDAEVVKSPAA
jgi:hypothetical protein